ncbi:hypothetical protein B0H19DRAFT_1274434 [Mycena capillaripes]|nr:hypothetical protein B0H19DRAFT_1274434 [Mycena capillaripes]
MGDPARGASRALSAEDDTPFDFPARRPSFPASARPLALHFRRAAYYFPSLSFKFEESVDPFASVSVPLPRSLPLPLVAAPRLLIQTPFTRRVSAWLPPHPTPPVRIKKHRSRPTSLALLNTPAMPPPTRLPPRAPLPVPADCEADTLPADITYIMCGSRGSRGKSAYRRESALDFAAYAADYAAYASLLRTPTPS